MEQRLETVNLVEFWGLPPLILFFNVSIGWFGRFVLSTECYRTRKLGYNNLNWPRCSARVTESLALTDGGFCDTILSMFRLCSCGTKPQRSENHHFVMTSSCEPQCHHDIIMRTPRITGKPKFSWSGGP